VLSGGHTQAITAVVFTAKGDKLCSASLDSLVCVWDPVSSLTSCEMTLRGHTAGVLSMALCGEHLLASGSSDSSVRLWDLERGECTFIFDGHNFQVQSLALSSLSGLLYSASKDKVIHMWDVPKRAYAGTLSGAPLSVIDRELARIKSENYAQAVAVEGVELADAGPKKKKKKSSLYAFFGVTASVASTAAHASTRDDSPDSNKKKPSPHFNLILSITTSVLFNLAEFIFDVAGTTFNILFLAKSLLLIARFDLDLRFDALERAMRAVLGPFHFIATALRAIVRAFEFSIKWNCTGVLAASLPLISLLSGFILFIFVRGDALLLLNLASKRFSSTWKKSHQTLWTLFVRSASRMITGLVQLVLVTFSSPIAALFEPSDNSTVGSSSSTQTKKQSAIKRLIGGTSRSCSRIDVAIQQAQIFIFIVCFAVIIITAIYAFGARHRRVIAGKRRFFLARWMIRFYELFTPYLLATLGVWTPHLADSYGILTRSRRNLHSLEKDADPVQDVLRITGSTRGLIWCLVPGLGFLSRFAEAVNSPPIFVFDRRLTLRQAFPLRLALWLLRMLQFSLALAFVASARLPLAAILYASLIPELIWNVVREVLGNFA
jgi:hypothetical protein